MLNYKVRQKKDQALLWISVGMLVAGVGLGGCGEAVLAWLGC